MADAIALIGIEKQHLVGFGDGLIVPNAANVDTAVRENELRAPGALFRTLVFARPPATRIGDRDSARAEQPLGNDFRHPSTPPDSTDSVYSHPVQ
jgi:hypothetical protein